MEIKKITAEESYIVRHPVLRSGRPIQDCAFQYDDHPSSIHLSLEVEGKVISVISVLPIRCENFPKLVAMRLRGIATLESYRRQGYGTQLINGVEKRLLKKKGIELIWLDARINASDFYRKMGYKTIGDHFNIKGIGTHQQFFKMINR